MAPTSLPAMPSLSMALVSMARPGTSASWLLPAAKVRRRSNIGNWGAATNSTLAPSAVCQVWIFRLRRAGAWPSRAASEVSFSGLAGALIFAALLAITNSPREMGRARPNRTILMRRLRDLLMAALLRQGMDNAQAPMGEVVAGGLLDIGGGDGAQLGQLGVHQLPGQADGFPLTD